MNEWKSKTPKLLSTQEAAVLLRIKPCTVRNERIRGKLGFVKFGARIYHSMEQINEYLERQTVHACVSAQVDQNRDRSETIGSVRSPDEMVETTHGVGLGTTAELGRRAVSALAQEIFKRPASSSRPGWSKTTKPVEKPDKTKS
jgi:excisionase family DNA binding protein